jgi:hypothetical protein
MLVVVQYRSFVVKLSWPCTSIVLAAVALLRRSYKQVYYSIAISQSVTGTQIDEERSSEGGQEKRRQRICRVNSLSARWFAQRMFMGCVRWSINHPFDFTLSCVCFTPVSATGYGASILSI